MPLLKQAPARCVLHALALATLATLTLASEHVFAAGFTDGADPEMTEAQALPPIPLPLSSKIEYANGFADLKTSLDQQGLGDLAGAPVTPEIAGDMPDSTIQVTSSGGLMYWAPGGFPTFTTDAVHRWALAPKRGLVSWEGDSLEPPPPALAPTAAAVYAGSNPAAYIAAHSRYGQRAVCVSRIETGSWTAFYNPTPWGGGQHAQGYFGWLPSTWNGPLVSGHPEMGSVGQGGRIMDLDAEIRGFDRMLDVHRGREFAGIAAGSC